MVLPWLSDSSPIVPFLSPLLSFCFSDGAPTAFLLCFSADPMADLCFSYGFLFCFPIVFLSCSYGLLLFLRDALMVILCFFFGAPAVNYAFPMVFLWFLCSSFLQFSHQHLQKNLYFGVPGTLFLELFRALGAPWTPSGAKCVLKAGLGCIFCGF